MARSAAAQTSRTAESAKLHVQGVSLSFGGPDERRIEVIRDIDLAIGAGEFCTIVGPSGCGKSTLLSIIAGLIKPDRGACTLDGAPITLGDPRIGYMFQADTLLPWATALENVRFPLDAVGRRDDGRCRELLKRVGVGDFTDCYP